MTGLEQIGERVLLALLAGLMTAVASVVTTLKVVTKHLESRNKDDDMTGSDCKADQEVERAVRDVADARGKILHEVRNVQQAVFAMGEDQRAGVAQLKRLADAADLVVQHLERAADREDERWRRNFDQLSSLEREMRALRANGKAGSP